MKKLFFDYIAAPDLEGFLKLREAVLSHDEFDPYSSELDEVDNLVAREEFERVVEVISSNLIPNHFLSPGAHLKLGFSHHKLGNRDRADAVKMISSALLHGIELTGDGSKEAPFLVTRTSDEYDYLFAHQLPLEGQSLQEKGDRNFDVMTVTGHQPIWFDVTDIYAILGKRSQG